MALCTFLSFDANGQKGSESVRPAAVAGSFYPASKDTLSKDLSDLFKSLVPQQKGADIAALIVPHAGYVFSGSVAAAAYAQIDPEHAYEHVFLIGPSHHIYMEGASVNSQYEYYSTPLGKVQVDTKLCDKIIKENKYFSCNPAAHDKEHCLEVQLPFLQYRLKKMPPIVPIIIGTQSLSVIRSIAEALKPYFNEKNLFVISSDFSHYPSYADAEVVDKRTGDGVSSGSLENFIRSLEENEKQHVPNLATSACGQSAIAVMLQIISNRNDIDIHHLVYQNSGDSKYGDHIQVVGYHSFAFIRKKKESDTLSFSLSEKEKQTLLHIARRAIQNKLNHSYQSAVDESELTDTLRMKCGAFVTLNEHGQLRGCIGHFGSDIPLYQAVEEMAKAAAFEDPRFFPLQSNEFHQIDIEISVLSPMKRIHDISEFTLGKQGIYISKGYQSGTFLPQVAEETHWTKEEFLGHCARDKAGLSWDGWKDADLYTYEAVIIKENKDGE